MRRRDFFEQSLGTDRWSSSDPSDNEIIRKLFKRETREGEEKLMLAVLSDAIELFQKHVLSKDKNRRNLFHEVEEWFLEKESNQLFSFESICETLELHPDYLRQRLISWGKEARRKEHSLQARRGSRKKLVKTRFTRTSLRFSKTA
jgi:hypothetical protein